MKQIKYLQINISRHSMAHSSSNNKYYNKYNNYNSRIKERKKYIQIDGYNVSSYTVCTHYSTMSVSPYTICV